MQPAVYLDIFISVTSTYYILCVGVMFGLFMVWNGMTFHFFTDPFVFEVFSGTLKMQDWKMRHQEKYGTLQMY